MGNGPSNGHDHQFDGCTTLGYRILGVQPDSPASRAGLVSFFDFLVGVNGQLLFDNGAKSGEEDGGDDEFFEDLDFVAILKDHVDKEIELLVWNIKSQTQRFINLIPTTNWPGTGLLGVTIRMDDYATAEEKLLRILNVEPKSPAAVAGLTPSTDYLLGTTMESFEDEEVLGDVLYDNEDHTLEVYVYNTESDVVRVVTLLPSLNWGGRGLLGAEVGRGYLHRLPKRCRSSLGVSFERAVDNIYTNDSGVINAVKDIQQPKSEKVSTTQEKLSQIDLDGNDNKNIVVDPIEPQVIEKSTISDAEPKPEDTVPPSRPATLEMEKVNTFLGADDLPVPPTLIGHRTSSPSLHEDDLPPPPILDLGLEATDENTPNQIIDLR